MFVPHNMCYVHKLGHFGLYKYNSQTAHACLSHNASHISLYIYTYEIYTSYMCVQKVRQIFVNRKLFQVCGNLFVHPLMFPTLIIILCTTMTSNLLIKIIVIILYP